MRLRSPAGRGLLVGAILGSGLALLDSTVVNVALPHIGTDLGASMAGLQWTVNAYTLMLAALVLVGGALGDRFGRRRIFVLGMVWFTVGSVLCGLAPGIGWLVAARALQGIGAALLTPGSLALIEATLREEDRARAIGAWAGWSGVAAALGPPIGGYLIDTLGWRWIFFINVPVAAVAVGVTLRYVPESRDPYPPAGYDLLGAGLCVLGLAGLTYALVQAPGAGASVAVLGAGLVGVAALAGFAMVERSSRHPMVPPRLFDSIEFTAINLVTFAVYAALGGVLFFLVLQLQVVDGFSALAAGLANLPLTVLLLVGSPWAGALSRRTGARLPLTIGSFTCALGTLAMLRIGSSTSYWWEVLPAVTLFGLGLTILVAPLTATVLAAAEVRFAGVASGVNNAVARTGSLLAVAALPLLVGLSGTSYADPARVNGAFRLAMLWCAGLLLAGALLSWVLIPARAAAISQPSDG